jgi:hypothetical protein
MLNNPEDGYYYPYILACNVFVVVYLCLSVYLFAQPWHVIDSLLWPWQLSYVGLFQALRLISTERI